MAEEDHVLRLELRTDCCPWPSGCEECRAAMRELLPLVLQVFRAAPEEDISASVRVLGIDDGFGGILPLDPLPPMA